MTNLRIDPALALKSLRALAALSIAATLLGGAASAAELLPISTTLGIENVRLPRGEHMGLVGGSLLFDVGGDWRLGPAAYGAASGQRGGFFVGGVELQRRWRLGSGLSLATGMYAGGGGGAAAPVGGGLMWRPAVTVLKDIGPSLQLGLSWSSVRFPSGQIGSNQLGIVLGWRSEFAHLDGAHGDPAPWLDRVTGLGFDRMSATASRYAIRDGAGGRRIGLVGARAERRTGIDGLDGGLEAAAAAHGDAAGYMEILGTAAFSMAPLRVALPAWRIGVRGGIGLAGGGAVPTGGGLIGKASATTQWRFAPGWTLGGEYGWVRGANGDLRARQAQLWLGTDLEPRVDGDARRAGRVVRSEWVGALQHHTRIARRDGTRAPLDTFGLKLNRYLGDSFYLSGQHSAFAGGAGAYSVGLIGAGLATSPATPWRVGAELLVGAAGGGGVASAGGALAQGLAWASWNPALGGEWRAGFGATRMLRGGATSPVVELSWSRAFGMAGR